MNAPSRQADLYGRCATPIDSLAWGANLPFVCLMHRSPLAALLNETNTTVTGITTHPTPGTLLTDTRSSSGVHTPMPCCTSSPSPLTRYVEVFRGLVTCHLFDLHKKRRNSRHLSRANGLLPLHPTGFNRTPPFHPHKHSVFSASCTEQALMLPPHTLPHPNYITHALQPSDRS